MVQDNTSTKSVPDEPYSLQMHRKQSFWQVTFPIVLASLLLLVFLILIIVFSGGFGDNLTSIGAAAAVFVVIPHLLGLLIWLAILIALAFGVNALKEILPGKGVLVLEFLHRMQLETHKISNLAAQPSIRFASKAAQIKQFMTSLKQRLR